MKNWMKILVVSSACSCVFAIPAMTSTGLEAGSSLAGISVALNNFYAGNMELEKQLASIYFDMETKAGKNQGGGGNSKSTSAGDSQDSSEADVLVGQAVQAAQAPEEIKVSKSLAYDSVAASEVNDSVNIRTETNTASGVTGKIFNDPTATILDTVDGEGGKWYKIQFGSVTGYIKVGYFVTGQQVEAKAKKVETTYGTIVGVPSLRLRDTPNLEGKTLTLLSEEAHYVVTGEEGDFLKVSVDSDLEGYVFKEYTKANVEFNKAMFVEEGKAEAAEEAKRREDAEKVIKALEEAKKKEVEKKTTEATTKAQKTTEVLTAAVPKKEETEGTDPVVQTIAVNPKNGNGSIVTAPTTQKATESTQSKGPGLLEISSSEAISTTRSAVVTYAKQFLGNPYVYDGVSPIGGADCSGFTQSIFSHFGISTGRSSRDQAARGKTISVSEAKPGDLLSYVNGDCINHVVLHTGGGQVIHASSSTTGICTSPVNCRTPYKAVMFLG